MSTLKVNTIRHSTASSDAITFASDGTATAKITNNLSNKNLIINGAMNIAQRGASATATVSYGTVDRFRISANGLDNNPDQAQIALTSSDTGPWEKGFRNAWQITNGNQSSGAGSGDEMELQYMAEAQDLANSGWDYTSASSYITVSFWVKSSVAQNFYGYMTTLDGTRQSYPYETGSLSANTWTKITKTIPGASGVQFDNNNEAAFYFNFLVPFSGTDKTSSGVTLNQWGAYSGSNRMPDNTSTWYTTDDATIAVTGVQLEVGDVATDFEHRSYGDELARCQRYYWRKGGVQWSHAGFGLMASTTQVRAYVQFPVTMRAVPTLSGSGMYVDSETAGSEDITAFANTYLYNSGGQARLTNDSASFGAGTAVNIGLNSTTAYFAGDAEL